MRRLNVLELQPLTSHTQVGTLFNKAEIPVFV